MDIEWAKEVILRLSDFKTNEYANLIGGRNYEPAEENPMIVSTRSHEQ